MVRDGIGLFLYLLIEQSLLEFLRLLFLLGGSQVSMVVMNLVYGSTTQMSPAGAEMRGWRPI